MNLTGCPLRAGRAVLNEPDGLVTSRSDPKFSKKISTSSEVLGGASGTRTLDLVNTP